MSPHRTLLGLSRAASRRAALRSTLLLPSIALALAFGMALAVWRRSALAERPLPRLPVRRRPVGAPRSSRLRRLQGPAPALSPPSAFWDAAPEPSEA